MLNADKRIDSKDKLDEWIDYEISKYGIKRNILRFLFPISECDVLSKHVILLRRTEFYINTKKKIRANIEKILLHRLQNKYSLHIPVNTCAKGLKIMHVGPILINGGATVGENCSFHINTALVADGTSNSAPILQDGVVLGVGAVVIGGVTIASNIAVGANAVVTKDFREEDIAIAGVPARKISDNGRSKWNKK